MRYICPSHYIPSTYAEIDRDGDTLRGPDGKTQNEREAERQRIRVENGAPPHSQRLTAAILDWAFETHMGYRCWYCGTLSPAGIERAERKAA